MIPATQFLRAISENALGRIPIITDESESYPNLDDLSGALPEGSFTALVSEDGSCLGLRAFTDDAHVPEVINCLGSPSIAFGRPAQIALIYLLDQPATGENLDRLEPVALAGTGRSAIDQTCPLPGVDNWDFARDDDEQSLAEGLQRFSTDDLIGRFEKFAASGLAELKAEAIEKLNDSFVYGEFDDPAFGNREISIGWSNKGRQGKEWPAKKLTVAEFLGSVTQHKVGKKDGPAILQGEALEGKRLKTAIKTCYIAGIDVDNGASVSAVRDRALYLGLTALIYTTHSHMKPETGIAESAYAAWARTNGQNLEPTVESVRAFLLEHRKITADLAQTIVQVRREQSASGMQFVVTHGPMPRFRMIFILGKPYVFAERGKSHNEAMKDWSRGLRAIADLMGVAMDESCVDPSRLFYLARHADGAAHETHLVCGHALDFDALLLENAAEEPLPRAKKASKEKLRPEPPKGSTVTKRGTNLLSFGHEWRKNFELQDLFEAYAPDRIRNRRDGKIEVECPFDGLHSNPGDPNDRACFVANDPASSEKTGFVFACQHASCKGRGKLEMLCKAVDDDWIGEDLLSDPQFAKVLPTGTQPGASHGDHPQASATARVQIDASADFSINVGRAWTALIKKNNQEHRLFNTAKGMSRVVKEPMSGELRSENIGTDTLRFELDRHVAWMAGSNNAKKQKQIRVPEDVARELLADDCNRLPRLKGIVHTPFFVKIDGRARLVDRPGYDPESGFFYDQSPDLQVPPVSDYPSDEEVLVALDLLLNNVLVDFPFHDGDSGSGSSKAHALTLLLQLFMRELIDGPTPIYFINKPMAGTGGGLLVDLIMIIATGSEGQAQSESNNEEERRKSITAQLSSSFRYYWLDNVNYRLDSSAFASAVTSGFVQDRILGRSEIRRMPVRLTWIFAGNNMQVSHEISRRLIPIGLDAKRDPLTRKAFKHLYPKEWVRDNRSKLVWACLTLIQRGVNSGGKAWVGNTLPSFEHWSTTFGALFASIGVDGFLQNMHLVKGGANEEQNAWVAFITQWATRFGLNAKRIVGDPDGSTTQSGSHGDKSLVTVIEENSIDIDLKGFDGRAKARSLGHHLRRKNDNIFSIVLNGAAIDVRLRSAMDNSLNQKIYWLEKIG